MHHGVALAEPGRGLIWDDSGIGRFHAVRYAAVLIPKGFFRRGLDWSDGSPRRGPPRFPGPASSNMPSNYDSHYAIGDLVGVEAEALPRD